MGRERPFPIEEPNGNFFFYSLPGEGCQALNVLQGAFKQEMYTNDGEEYCFLCAAGPNGYKFARRDLQKSWFGPVIALIKYLTTELSAQHCEHAERGTGMTLSTGDYIHRCHFIGHSACWGCVRDWTAVDKRLQTSLAWGLF